MERITSDQEYQKELLMFLDQLLYAAFLLKKDNDYENISMRGLVITERELEQAFSLLSKEEQLPEEAVEILGRQESLIRCMEKIEGDNLRFFRLCRDFELTKTECLALLLAAAPGFDRKYERIYGYLQDHADIPSPTRGLCASLAELAGGTDKEEISAFLTGNGNLEYLLETKQSEGKGLSSIYRLKPQVQGYLQGSEKLTGHLEKCEKFLWTDGIPPMEIRRDYLDKLGMLWEQLRGEAGEARNTGFCPEDSCMLLIYGREGIGKHFLLRQLAVEKKFNILFLDIQALMYEKTEVIFDTLKELYVQSVLSKAAICLTEGELMQETEEEGRRPRQDKRKLILEYVGGHVPYFFLLSREKEVQTADFGGRKLCIELPYLSAGEKIRLWKSWGAQYPLDDTVSLEQNGNKYILTPKGIQDALETAKLLARMDNSSTISQEHIRRAVKQNQPNQLGTYATLINSGFAWDDLILGEEQKRQMRMVCDQVKYRDVVGEKWGFHKKTPYGRGLSVLFYGPPGTGKTMAAQVMANELGLDLYRIDISQMVSKYIGETQKNISRLFRKAKDINALLFFDEADSLFAKRSEAQDSNDRNANAETAHLLQKLEDYEGITVLATNYLNNIDDAFKRRIKFIIKIAFPEPEVRLQLWRSTLPSSAVCEEELDFEFFAENFELSGSNIKEILTNAAYLAASEHRGLKNSDLVEAVKLNFAKYGKVLGKSDFGYLA